MTRAVVPLGRFQRVLAEYGERGEQACIDALRRTVRFGHTAAVRSTKRVRDPYRIRASGTFEQSWRTDVIKNGAVIMNVASHSIAVEAGQPPGTRAKLEDIIEWVYQKRLASRAKPIPKPRSKGPKKPPKSGGSSENPGSSGESGGNPGSPGSSSGESPKPKKSDRQRKAARIRAGRARKRKLKKAVAAHEKAVATATGIAIAVKLSIFKRGTKARRPLGKAMPAIAKRSAREIKKGLAQLGRNLPR